MADKISSEFFPEQVRVGPTVHYDKRQRRFIETEFATPEKSKPKSIGNGETAAQLQSPCTPSIFVTIADDPVTPSAPIEVIDPETPPEPDPDQSQRLDRARAIVDATLKEPEPDLSLFDARSELHREMSQDVDKQDCYVHMRFHITDGDLKNLRVSMHKHDTQEQPSEFGLNDSADQVDCYIGRTVSNFLEHYWP